MSLASGFIEWKGVLRFFVNWWDANIIVHFERVLNGFLNVIGLADLPLWAINYIALAMIFSWSFLRMELFRFRFIERHLLWNEIITLAPNQRIMHVRSTKRGFLVHSVFTAIFWPLYFARAVFVIYRTSFSADDRREDKNRALLTLLPFLIFFALCALNFLLA